jgi:RNA polymerase sigma factor (sigma-70 family)
MTQEQHKPEKKVSFLNFKVEGGTPGWNDFCKDFEELLNPNHPSAVSLTCYIRRTVRQFRLPSIAESDILAEVFLRAHKLIVLGGGVIIRHPGAWVRQTAFNYIRELSRNHQRTSSMEFDIPDEQGHSPIDGLILQADIAILERALQELDPDEQRLLTLKIVDELSWAEIRIILAGEGKTVSEAALRKHKERALKHLEQTYHTLKHIPILEKEIEDEQKHQNNLFQSETAERSTETFLPTTKGEIIDNHIDQNSSLFEETEKDLSLLSESLQSSSEKSFEKEAKLSRGRPSKQESTSGSGKKTGKRLSISFPKKISAQLETIAEQEDLPIGEVVRKSVARDLYIQEQLAKGYKLLLQEKNGQMHELHQL